jgi:hypothetical protein
MAPARSSALAFAAIALAALFVACDTEAGSPGAISSPTSTPVIRVTPTVTPSPSPTPTGTPAPGPVGYFDLKYLLLDNYPDFFFCDPDFYPIAREDEMVLALQRFPGIEANEEEFAAVLIHLNLQPGAFTDGQKLAIYREHKRLAALPFEETAEGYKFVLRTSTDMASGVAVEGVISRSGVVKVTATSDAFVTCPICLAAGTLIATPDGDMPVRNLREGMFVWTQDESGRRVAAEVIRTGSMAAVAGQVIVHVVLDDGRELYVSPGHPAADGRPIGGLLAGDVLGGAKILSADALPYAGDATFDILPAGGTGLYWANGTLIGSTLTR